MNPLLREDLFHGFFHQQTCCKNKMTFSTFNKRYLHLVYLYIIAYRISNNLPDPVSILAPSLYITTRKEECANGNDFAAHPGRRISDRCHVLLTISDRNQTRWRHPIHPDSSGQNETVKWIKHAPASNSGCVS
jgi:hypothetical protein